MRLTSSSAPATIAREASSASSRMRAASASAAVTRLAATALSSWASRSALAMSSRNRLATRCTTAWIRRAARRQVAGAVGSTGAIADRSASCSAVASRACMVCWVQAVCSSAAASRGPPRPAPRGAPPRTSVCAWARTCSASASTAWAWVSASLRSASASWPPRRARPRRPRRRRSAAPRRRGPSRAAAGASRRWRWSAAAGSARRWSRRAVGLGRRLDAQPLGLGTVPPSSWSGGSPVALGRLVRLGDDLVPLGLGGLEQHPDLLARVGDDWRASLRRVGEPASAWASARAAASRSVAASSCSRRDSASSIWASAVASAACCSAWLRSSSATCWACSNSWAAAVPCVDWPTGLSASASSRLWVDRLHSVHQVLVRRPRPPQAPYLVGSRTRGAYCAIALGR